jgi:hypothetical protein
MANQGRNDSMPLKTTFRSRAALVSLALAVLAVAGCGGSTKTVTTTPLPPGVAPAAPTPKAINATYHVILTGKLHKVYRGVRGFKRGSPHGSASAVVTINASTNEFCWEFSQLSNVSSPTVARLFRNFPGAPGTGGFDLGRRYKSSGCIHMDPEVLGLITEKPEQFYLNIHNASYPSGAVRAPLRAASSTELPAPQVEGTTSPSSG